MQITLHLRQADEVTPTQRSRMFQQKPCLLLASLKTRVTEQRGHLLG